MAAAEFTVQCSYSAWNYVIFAIQILFLCIGVGLAISVRNVPSLFNESRLIGWAVYNWAGQCVRGRRRGGSHRGPSG